MEQFPAFVDWVWVGRLPELGFVVFDPEIANIFLDDTVSLWVEQTKTRRYFPIESIRNRLRSYLHTITEADRVLVVRRYWYWKTGCLTEDEFRRRKALEADNAMVEAHFAFNEFASEYSSAARAEYEMSDEDAYRRVLCDRQDSLT